MNKLLILSLFALVQTAALAAGPANPPANILPATRPAREIPLSSLYVTSWQEGMTRVSELPTMEKGREVFPQAGLAWGKDFEEMAKAPVTPLPGGDQSKPIAVRAGDKDAPLWAVIYLGSDGSRPVQWVVDKVTMPSKNQWAVLYHHAPPGPVTQDERAYYLWVPLGPVDAGDYSLRLVESGKVTAERIWTVSQKGQPGAATQPSAAKPVAKDGLQATVTLPKATFAFDEPLKFTLQFKNVSDKAFTLYDAAYFWDWEICFEDVKAGGPWKLLKTFEDDRMMGNAVRMLKPGDTMEVPVILDPMRPGRFMFQWQGDQLQKRPNIDRLGPGAYRLTLKIDLKANPSANAKWMVVPFWTGQISTEPVALEITETAAAPTTRPAGAARSTKGWELYVWQEDAQVYYALLPGTNRLKSDQEVAAAAVKTLDLIKEQLDAIKAGQSISICGRRLLDAPPASEGAALGDYCRKIELKVLR